MTNPILDFVLDIVDEGLHPHAVSVERTHQGYWQCRVELDDFCAEGDGDNPVKVVVDRRNLPSGITLRGRERFAPRVMPLELPSRRNISGWVRDVAAAGRSPDWCWIGRYHCLTKPIIWLREPLRSALEAKHVS